MRNRVFYYLFFYGLFSLSLRSSCSAQALDFRSLKALIQEKKINSIATLLPFLPTPYRSKYALLFKSRSLHESSYNDPRVLLFGETAKFILSFNGSPSQRGFDALETMDFDENSKEFQFREILFPEESKLRGAVTFSEINPEKCIQCHSNPPHPIWDTHPLWPGAYGERYHSPLSEPEETGLAGFLATAPRNPRYRHLMNLKNFANRETFYPSPKKRYDGTSQESPNEEISLFLTQMNLKRIIKTIYEAPHFKPFGYALLGSLHRNCGNIEDFIPKPGRDLFLKKYETFLMQTLKKNSEQEELKKLRAVSWTTPLTMSLTEKNNFYRVDKIESLDSVRFLAEEGLGLSTSQWTTALEGQTYDFSTSQLLTSELESTLLTAVAEYDPKIQTLAFLSRLSSSEKYCNYLRNQSQLALGQLSPDQDSDPAPRASLRDSFPNSVEQPSQQPPLIKTCSHCHQGVVAPAIPFNQPRELAKLLNSGHYPRGTLLEEILFRLSPQAREKRMPLGLNVPESDRKNLERYLRNLTPVNEKSPTP